MEINWKDFEKIQMRVGTIIEVNDFPEARKPSYKLKVDFGSNIGIKKTSAQITFHYDKNELIGKQIIAVVNFAPKQIANFMSECLVMGIYDEDNQVVLIKPDKEIANGSIIG
ncbi:tRNA-binding protein [Flavobacteriaceae bacterium Ap0902]|nr:tRNA-binding protein [Flavobacteriaceae bacterium Ap0902]